MAVSQSGETFDTLAAVQEVTRKGGRVLGIVNAVGSTIARTCGRGIYLHAGPEISVVATKTFTCTAVAFALLAIHLGRLRDLSSARGARLIAALEALPEQIAGILADEDAVEVIARQIATYQNIFFIGRAGGYPVAMEGALKLKEVSYRHAEAYPASELKHGPLALIDARTPTIVVLPRDELYAKNLSTIEEIHARRGPTFIVTQARLPTAGCTWRAAGTCVGTGARPDPDDDSAAVAGVWRGPRLWDGDRSTQEPGQIRDRGVGGAFPQGPGVSCTRAIAGSGSAVCCHATLARCASSTRTKASWRRRASGTGTPWSRIAK